MRRGARTFLLFATAAGRRGVVDALAVTALAALGAALLDATPGNGRTKWPERFESNGERLYFTGRSDRSTAMIPSGGDHHMMMRRGACVACHGADRQGGGLAMRFWQVAPPLTPAGLAGEHGGEDDGHAHAAYTAATLARAITEGVGPEGEPLDPAMPRWSMSEADLADLVAFLMDDAPAEH